MSSSQEEGSVDRDEETAVDLQDNRSFKDFYKDEGLVEIVRKYDSFEKGTVVNVRSDGRLFIGGTATNQLKISDTTIQIMKENSTWGKKLSIGKNCYVVVGTGLGTNLHAIIAKSKKDKDFKDWLEKDWKGKKSDLQVMHLDDCRKDSV